MSWFSSMVSGAIPLASAAGGFALGGPVGAGLGFLGGNALVGNYWAGKNYDAQQDQYNYSRDLQQQLFGREDTSVARRALDLESVGLSKTLAAGSGAGAGSIVSTTAPQRDVPENDAGLVLGLLSMDKDFQMKDAQIANLVQQNHNLDTQEKLLNAQKKQSEASTALDLHDLKYMRKNKVWRGSSQLGRTGSDIVNYIGEAYDNVRNYNQTGKSADPRNYPYQDRRGKFRYDGFEKVYMP